jgi:O-antigen/teichoic acid export membrane protein
MGLGAALVQRASVTETDVRYVFSRVMIASVLVALTAFSVAPSVAQYIGDERVADVVQTLVPVFVFQAVAVVPSALLRRHLAFKSVQLVQISSYLVGFLVVGVGLAALGAGVRSLTAAWIVQSGLAAVLYYSLCRHSIRPLLRRNQRMGMYGLRVFLTNIANWTIENVDNLLVGRMFGTTALGLYSVSYNLVRTPCAHLVVAIQSVLFSASARVQDDGTGLRQTYLTAISAVALLALPVFFGIAAVADTIVETLFGSDWVDASSFLVPLAIAMAFHALMSVTGPVLWGKGVPGAELTVQTGVAVALCCALVVAGIYSSVAMAWAVTAVYAARFVAMTLVLLKHIKLSPRHFLRAIRGPILVAILTTPVLLLLDRGIVIEVVAVKLVIEIVVGGLMLVLLVLMFPKSVLSDELARIVARIFRATPLVAGWVERVACAPRGSDQR